MANPLQQALQRDYMEDLLDNKLGPLKPALSHLGLYFGIVVYTAMGAKVCQLHQLPVMWPDYFRL